MKKCFALFVSHKVFVSMQKVEQQNICEFKCTGQDRAEEHWLRSLGSSPDSVTSYVLNRSRWDQGTN